MPISQTKTKSQTDWKRVKKEAKANAPIPHSPEDGPYNPNDDAEVDAYWDKAKVRRGRGPQREPTKEVITIRLSAHVVEHFRAGGKGWQSRVNEALSEWVAKHPRH
jgi:uncharacterized protein (DUF4415 family)